MYCGGVRGYLDSTTRCLVTISEKSICRNGKPPVMCVYEGKRQRKLDRPDLTGRTYLL